VTLKKRSWRWLRLAGPVAVVLAVFVTTGIIHSLQQADPGDRNYLNPGSTASIGSSRLADALRGQGIQVQRVTSTYQASITLWSQPDSTLFVTTPGYTDVEHLTDSHWFPAGSHIVLVRPDYGFLSEADWPAVTAGERWTASAPIPGCPLFRDVAAVHKQYYRTSAGSRCYEGGVVEFGVNRATVSVVGASDPFRNDRLGEHGNLGFALSVLGRNRQVIWLDRHSSDSWPTSDGPVVTDRPAPDGVDSSSFSEDSPGPSATPRDASPVPADDGQQQRTHEPNGAQQEARRQANAFPPRVWAVVLLILLAGAAFAAASARRLGTPIAERLPSRVPANETMLGHGRLYQRGGSRGPSLRILKKAARRRITDHLGLSPAATDEALADATGIPEERFTEVFSSNYRLNRDADLMAATKQLQDLMRDVMNEGEEQ
jgi:hypothetical protein